MSYKLAVQMDPIDTIHIRGDTTFALMLEAQNRKVQLFYYTPETLSLKASKVVAQVAPIKVRDVESDHFELGKVAETDLSSFDAILARQDPPFDMAYITATHLLEKLHPKTYVMNDPASVRNAPEKILVTEFPDLMPPTMVTSDKMQIEAFRAEQGDIILKPLFGNGGAGVFLLRHNDQNLGALLEMFNATSNVPLMIQRYLPDVRQGDKRIILIDGEPVAALNRLPNKGEARSNMHAGGRPELSELTQRDQEICAAIKPALIKRDLILVGIDVIGDYITEINVTSPTGFREIKKFGGPDIAPLVFAALEKRMGKNP